MRREGGYYFYLWYKSDFQAVRASAEEEQVGELPQQKLRQEVATEQFPSHVIPTLDLLEAPEEEAARDPLSQVSIFTL